MIGDVPSLQLVLTPCHDWRPLHPDSGAAQVKKTGNKEVQRHRLHFQRFLVIGNGSFRGANEDKRGGGLTPPAQGGMLEGIALD
jgi:hypothetical protein